MGVHEDRCVPARGKVALPTEGAKPSICMGRRPASRSSWRAGATLARRGTIGREEPAAARGLAGDAAAEARARACAEAAGGGHGGDGRPPRSGRASDGPAGAASRLRRRGPPGRARTSRPRRRVRRWSSCCRPWCAGSRGRATGEGDRQARARGRGDGRGRGRGRVGPRPGEVHLKAPAGVDADAWRKRVEARLSARGLQVEGVVAE